MREGFEETKREREREREREKYTKGYPARRLAEKRKSVDREKRVRRTNSHIQHNLYIYIYIYMEREGERKREREREREREDSDREN